MLKTKYELLCSLKVIEFEIAELARYSKEFDGCYELLRKKLDDLCSFIKSEENSWKWDQWGALQEIQELSERLRETSVSALCDVEKYQSVRAEQYGISSSQYITSLARSVKEEYRYLGIHKASTVLFIGSGAFPTTALTIAKETGARVICLDIDREAIDLSIQVARASGLEKQLSFLHGEIQNYKEFENITHVLVASLVKNKLEVIDALQDKVTEETKVIVRFGNGLKSIFNYPIGETITGWEQTYMEPGNNDTIYETLVLEKQSKALA
ncbi:nicotianamine synthase family protein [Guptibacillus algicola]|uniref:nicotianamine synthase family protein n=1 Tax=Guptibacillus algicola TaxID=225844 RepID=UPI001CD5B11D|nr:nicotianamine synthase family protein [Alkalihalobacillus algicola]MCA0987359.1 hypothetical protein [Alkalihalobacillus algicola]